MTQEMTIKKYSQAFKQQIVQEYEGGTSLTELQKKYGINGGSTIQGWVQRYGRSGLRHKLLVIQSPDEQNQVKVYQERIAQLEKVIAQLSLDKLMLEASLAEAEAELGHPIKKNDGSTSLSGPSKTINKPAGS